MSANNWLTLVIPKPEFGSRENRSTYYTMQVDEAQMKEAILKQTDLAENELVAQIKELIKE